MLTIEGKSRVYYGSAEIEDVVDGSTCGRMRASMGPIDINNLSWTTGPAPDNDGPTLMRDEDPPGKVYVRTSSLS